MIYAGIFLTSFISYVMSSIFNSGILFFLIFFTVIVFNIQFLSLFKGITDVNILILTFIESLIALFIWIKKGRPILKINPKNFLNKLKSALTEDKTFIPLFIGFLFLMGVSFILALFWPVSEADAATYHAYRVLFWLKDAQITHFETSDIRNLCMPFNSETVYLWILALTKKDVGYGMLQFISYFVFLNTYFKIMDFFNIEFKKQLWAVIMLTSFAGIIIQISSTQTDVLVATLIAVFLYYIIRYKNEGKYSLLFFSALSMGLSFGVKTTSFMVSFPLMIWLIFYLKKDFIKYFFTLFVNSAIFSSYAYILNYIDYNNFFSNNAFIIFNKFYGGIKVYFGNIFQYLIQFFDFTGLALANYLNDSIMRFKESVLTLFSMQQGYGILHPMTSVNVYMGEQKTAFGILGFFVFLPCSVLGFFKKDLKFFSALFWAPFLMLCGLMAYTIYGIRYTVCFVCLALPVLTLSYTKKLNILKLIAMYYMLFYMVWASLFISVRPFASMVKIYFKEKNINVMQNKIREKRYAFENPYHAVEAAAYRRLIKDSCKDGKKIGMLTGFSSYTYHVMYDGVNNNCSMEELNGVHIYDYDLSKYDLLIFKDDYASSFVLNKRDLEFPIDDRSERAECEYQARVMSPNDPPPSIEDTMKVICKVNEDYVKSLGFKKVRQDTYVPMGDDPSHTVNIGAWEKE